MLRGWGRDARLRVVVCLLMCSCNPARQLQQAKGENNASSTKSQLSSTTPHPSAPYLALFNRQVTSICVQFRGGIPMYWNWGLDWVITDGTLNN